MIDLFWRRQFVRDWLEAVRINGKPWDKTPPAPRLPDDVIAKTAAKYQEAFVVKGVRS